MSETKYTKGPWTVERQIQNYRSGATALCITSRSEGQVAQTVASIVSIASDKANARLISAAPELLEALQEAKAALEWCVEQGGGPVCEHESGAVCFCKENKAINSADAAIAKALGEQA